MDNIKTPSYYLNKIIQDIQFILDNMNHVTQESFTKNEVLNSAISFKLIQISENSKQLPNSLKEEYPNIPWNKMNGLRNRIVHDYGSVNLEVIYNTVVRDLPILLEELQKIIK